MVQLNLLGSKYQQKIELSKKKKKKIGEFFSLTYSRGWVGLPGDPTLGYSSEAGKHCCTAGFAFPALLNLHSNTSIQNPSQFPLFMFSE